MTTLLHRSPDTFVPTTGDNDWQARFAAAVARHPNRLAIRHRETWASTGLDWRGLGIEIARLRQGLHAYGLGRGSRLGLVGGLDATVLLLALAARLNGAELLPIPSDARPDLTHRLLHREGIRHLAVGSATSASRFTAEAAASGVQLFAVQGSSHPEGIISYDTVRAGWGGPSPSAGWLARWFGRGSDFWVDADSGDGSTVEDMLRLWLDDGACLTFAHGPDPAGVGRRRNRPTIIVMSPSRLRMLDMVMDAGLAAASASRKGLRPSSISALRRALGLHRARHLVLLGEGAAGYASVPCATRVRLARLGILTSDDRSPIVRRLEVGEAMILPVGSI